MLTSLHRIIPFMYWGAPILAASYSVWRRHLSNAKPGNNKHPILTSSVAPAVSLIIIAAVLGTGFCALHALTMVGTDNLADTILDAAFLREVVRAAYCVISFLLILKWLDRTLNWFSKTIFFVGRGSFMKQQRFAVAMVVRTGLLFGIGLPYLFAAAATYRPHIKLPGSAIARQMGAASVTFDSIDHLKLAGDWFSGAAGRGHTRASQSTVILCHGLLSGKESMPILVGALQAKGHNVLTFDFRAYGDSEGHLTTFGDRERMDVLGAVRWARKSKPDQSHHIYGIGVSTGAAALLLAAADPSPEGQSIETIVACDPYDRYSTLVRMSVAQNFTPPLPWLMLHVGLPLQNLQTGGDWRSAAPVEAAAAIAPRPLMIIHSTKARFIDFSMGQRIFDAADAPKSNVATADTDDEIMNDPRNIASMIYFLRTSVPLL